MTRTPRLIVAAACALALVAGAWRMLRSEPASPPAAPVEKTDAAVRAKTPRARAEEPAKADASPPAADEPQERGAPGHLAVHVTLRATGAPAVGAKVVVTEEDKKTHEATADAAGVARIAEALPADAVSYVVTLAGYVTRSTVCGVEPGKDSKVDVELERALVLEGVVREEDGRPLAGAHIVVPDDEHSFDLSSAPPHATATTGADGAFRLDQMPAEHAETIVVSAPHHIRTELRWTPATASPIEVRLAPAAVVTGVVRDPEGKPVADARIWAEPTAVPDVLAAKATWAGARADAEGRYEMEGLPLGCTWTVVAVAKGFARSAETTGVAVSAAHPEATCDLVLRKFGRIDFVVLDPRGVPVEKGKIEGTGKDAPLDPLELQPGGRASFDVTTPGVRHVEVDVPGFPVRGVDVDGVVSETKTVEVRLIAGVACSGVVVDDVGKPVAGAHVWAERESFEISFDDERGATTAADGTFRLDAIEAGPHDLSATADGYHHADARAVDAPASDLRIVLRRMEADGAVSFVPHVRDGVPRPKRFDVKYVHADGGHSVTISADWSDAANVQARRAGTWRAILQADGLAAIREFEVASGATVDLGEVFLDPGLTLEGRLVDAQGKVAFGPYVWINGDIVKYDAEGRFSVRNVPPGPVLVDVQGDPFFDQTLTYAFAANSRPLVVTMLRGGLLRGLVRDAAGAPVSDVQIVAESEPVDGAAADEDVTLRVTKFGGFSRRLRAGRWRVVVKRDDVALATKHVELTEGGETSVEFVVRR